MHNDRIGFLRRRAGTFLQHFVQAAGGRLPPSFFLFSVKFSPSAAFLVFCFLAGTHLFSIISFWNACRVFAVFLGQGLPCRRARLSNRAESVSGVELDLLFLECLADIVANAVARLVLLIFELCFILR